MNYLFNKSDDDVLPVGSGDDESIQVSVVQDTQSEVSNSSDEFFKNSPDLDNIDLTSNDKALADDSKMAVLKFIETFMNDKKKQGMDTEEILNSMGEAFSSTEKLSRATVTEFVKEKKQAIKRMEQQKKQEYMLRKQKQDEADMLDSVKERADSRLLEDDFVISNLDRQQDTNDYGAAEFTKLKYTPVCFGVNEFHNEGYTLRCLNESGRKPRLMVMVTIKDERPRALRDTLRAIGDNIAALQQAEQRFKGFDTDVWPNVLVVVVADGRLKIDPDTTQWLEEFGLLQESVMKYKVSNTNDAGDVEVRRTQLHLFERTVLLDKEVKPGPFNRGGASKLIPLPPLQVAFALKEQASGKLDSHWWFYDAFCPLVEPDYIISMKVGVCPSRMSFTRMLTALASNKSVGGVTGSLFVKQAYSNPFNFIKLAQQFEFKTLSLLNQTYESAFGYVLNLPDEFAGFRYAALKNRPLDAYFRPLEEDVEDIGPFRGNMFFAQSRILSAELFLNKGHSYCSTQVWGASAEVEVPDNLIDLLFERKRSINGSLFALLYYLENGYRLYTESSHDSLRRIVMILFYLFQVGLFALSWFHIGIFSLLVFYVSSDIQNLKVGTILDVDFTVSTDTISLFSSFAMVYAIVIVVQLVVGLGNKVHHAHRAYVLICAWYMFVSLSTFIVLGVVYANMAIPGIILAAAGGCVLLVSLFNMELPHTLLTLVPYVVFYPVLNIVLPIYSLCNLHDLSFGRQGINEVEVKNTEKRIRKLRGKLGKRYKHYKSGSVEFLAKERQQLEYNAKMVKREALFTGFRTLMLLGFVFTQVIFAGVLSFNVDSITFLTVFSYLVGGVIGFKGAFSLYYFIKTLAKYVMFVLFTRYGVRSCLLCYAEEMNLRQELADEKRKNLDVVGELSTVYNTDDPSLLFVRETADNGTGEVRESTVYDRKFLGNTV